MKGGYISEKREYKQMVNKIQNFYNKVKILINNAILYPLGFTNTIIIVVEMKKKDK